MIWLVIFLLILSGCEQGDKTAVIDEKIEDEHIYEYGIPVDIYSSEAGVIKRGDIFASIMEDLGVSNVKAIEIANIAKPTFDVRDLRLGNEYHAYFDQSDSSDVKLVYWVYEKSATSAVVFSLKDTIGCWTIEKDLELKRRYADVEIANSLWYDTQKAGISPLLALKLSDIYAWTIDFFGLQKGDRFIAVYDEIYCDGDLVDIGDVYYAMFKHEDREFECFYFDEGKEDSNKYWNEKGESLRKAFLKAPLKFSRISSGFSYARRHPVTRKVRPHTGVDYAAPTGTPVMSIGDGVVTSVKYEGAGGNTVRIKHNSVYRTAYLHLSRYGKGIKAGARVSQGQVIGYVGSTGRSTGPHLDFRVWKNNKPINPLKMDSPPALPVSKESMPAFEQAKIDAHAMRDAFIIGEYYNKIVINPLQIPL